MVYGSEERMGVMCSVDGTLQTVIILIINNHKKIKLNTIIIKKKYGPIDIELKQKQHQIEQL